MTQDELKALLDYNADTGIFRWKTRCGTANAGSVAGSKNQKGYVTIGIFGKCCRAHRLAWMFVFGECPKYLDHINQNKSDNRIANLRPVTNSENGHNKPKNKNNTSGHQGVSWCDQSRKWKAQIRINGKKKHLGSFDFPEQAGAAYNSFKANLLPQIAGNFL